MPLQPGDAGMFVWTSSYVEAMAAPRPDAPPPETAVQLGLVPHPEGGWYRRTWTAATTVDLPGRGSRPTATAVHYLLVPGEASRWHVVASEELWLWQRGGSLVLQLGGRGGEPAGGERVVLGPRALGGQRLQALVPAGIWQRTQPPVEEVLVTCVVSPGFDFADWRMA